MNERPSNDELQTLLKVHGTVDKVALATGFQRVLVREWYNDVKKADVISQILEENNLSDAIVTGGSIGKYGLSLRFKPGPKALPDISTFPELSPLDADIRAFKNTIKTKDRPHEEQAIQVISDLHHCRLLAGVIDESVTEAALNTYQNTCADLLRRHRLHSSVTTLNLCILGDVLHGYHNYPTQPREVTGMMSHQIKATAHLLIRHIERERYQYDCIKVFCVPGNHGRKGKESDIVTDNAELDVYRIVEAYFTNIPEVHFTIADENFYLVMDVLGRKYLLTHGDAIKGAGNPQALITNVMKWQAIMPRFDDVIMGHFHRCMSLSLPAPIDSVVGRALFVNGTASKDDGFLQTFGSSPSLQYWFAFSNGKRTTAEHKVDLYDNASHSQAA